MTPLTTRRRRLGVRGRAMLLCAFIWILIGVGVVTSTAPARPGTFHTVLPVGLSIALWLGSAAFAAATAFVQRFSALGISGLLLMPALRFTSYSWAWLMSLVGLEGYPGGWYSAAFYLAMIFLVWIVAQIPAQTGPPLTGPQEATQEGAADDH